MNNLVVPPMPEPSTKDFAQGRIQSWGSTGWQTTQREAALADELAKALERARKMLGPHSMHPDAEGMLMIDCALRTYTAARQMHKEARNGLRPY